MKIAISKNLTEHIPADLALVILLTLSCIAFVLVPPLNETPVRIILGLLLVLFLPGYSLIAALFPGKDDPDGIERIAPELRTQHRSRAAPGVGIELHAVREQAGADTCCALGLHGLACCNRRCAEAGAS